MFCSVLTRGGVSGLDRVLFRRQAEGVEAHRVQHALAVHPREAADDVGRRVPLRMPHVQPAAAGIREHVEHVQLLAARRRHLRRLERLVLVPVALPLGLDRRGGIAGHWRKGSGFGEVNGKQIGQQTGSNWEAFGKRLGSLLARSGPVCLCSRPSPAGGSSLRAAALCVSPLQAKCCGDFVLAKPGSGGRFPPVIVRLWAASILAPELMID